MSTWRDRAVRLAMGTLQTSGVSKIVEPYTRGLGAILMFHRVRPGIESGFQPNLGLEVSDTFLDALLGHLRARDFDIISIDDMVARLRGEAPPSKRPFIVLSFDDGYADVVEFALPVMERHRTPFVTYITTGFANHSARLWWIELEEAFRRLDHLDVTAGGRHFDYPCRTDAEKSFAYNELYWTLREGGEDQLMNVALELSEKTRIDIKRFAADLCSDWAELGELAKHELATIGGHSITHPRLAKIDAASARHEMAESCAEIEQRLGAKVRHFCYPVGDAGSAGQREFDFARELGMETGVTTRPGMIFPEHGAHLHSLPRVSINGKYQNLDFVDGLLTGAPFALRYLGRMVRTA